MSIKNSEEAYGLSQSIKYPYGNNIVMVLKCYDNSFIGFISQLNCQTYFNTFWNFTWWRSKHDIMKGNLSINLEKYKKARN